jgi:predicted Zn finger-like uncharacterized protein
MKIKCPNCSAAYDMDESRVPAAGVNIKCPRCQNPFRVTKQGVAPPAGATPAPAPAPAPSSTAATMMQNPDAVPLPAPERAPARAAAPPAGRPPGAMRPSAFAPPPPPPPMPASPNAATMAGLPPLDSEFSMPPGWDATGHPAQKTAMPPQRAPLNAAGIGSPAGTPAFPGMGASNAATMHVSDPFDQLPEPGSVVPNPFAPPPTGASMGGDSGFEVDFGDPSAAQTVHLSQAPAGGFDLSGLNTVSTPQRDPALDAALQMADSPGGDPFAYGGAPNPFAAPAGGHPSDGGAMLDFADDGAHAHQAAGPIRWQVRRKSGKVFGPFEPSAIVAMLQQGQLFGNEEISPDAENWYPIGAEPTFAAHIKSDGAGQVSASPSGLMAAGQERPAPPFIPVMSTGTTGPTSVPAGTVPFDVSKPTAAPKLGRRAVPVWVRLLMRRLPLLAGAAVVLLVIGGGIALGKFTEYGYFGMKFFAGKRPGERTVATASLEKFYQFAGEGTFSGSQKALGAVQTAVTQDEELPEALMNYATITCRLARRYGASTSKAEFEKAKALVNKHLDKKSSEGKIAFAAVSLCEGGPKVSDGKALIAPLATNPKAELLYAELLIALKDLKGAAAHLDTVLKNGGSGEGAMLRADVAHQLNDAEAEEAALAKAQELVPGHARARLWVARLRVSQSRLDDGGAILKEILVEPVVRSLDASEEALGHHLYGDVLVAGRQFAEAAKEYTRAADVEPDNVRHRAAAAQLALRLRQWSDANNAFEKAIDKGANDVDLLVGAGVSFTKLANFTKATQRLDEAKKKAPNDPTVLVAMGDLHVALGHGADAHKLFEEALTKDEKYFPALVADARLYMKEGKIEDAKACVEKAVAIAPDQSTVLAASGRFSLMTEEPKKAKEAFEKAVGKDIDDPENHSGLADSLAVLDELEASKASFEKAVALDDKETGLRMRFAQLLRRLKQQEEALKQIDAAIAVDAKDAKLHGVRGAVLFELERYADAETALKAALGLKDDEALAHEYYGRYLSLVKNDSTKAVEHMKRAVEIDSKNGPLRYQQGLVFERGQMLSDATESFRAALKLDPTLIDAEEHLGAVLTSQNLFADALETYKKVIAKEPKRVSAVAALADCHFKAGDIDEAIKYFKQALALNPEQGGVQYKLGRAYDKKGQTADAEKAYVAATKLDPKNPMPYYYLGYAYKARSRKKEAVQMFRAYLENNQEAKDREEINDEISYLTDGY